MHSAGARAGRSVAVVNYGSPGPATRGARCGALMPVPSVLTPTVLPPTVPRHGLGGGAAAVVRGLGVAGLAGPAHVAGAGAGAGGARAGGAGAGAGAGAGVGVGVVTGGMKVPAMAAAASATANVQRRLVVDPLPLPLSHVEAVFSVKPWTTATLVARARQFLGLCPALVPIIGSSVMLRRLVERLDVQQEYIRFGQTTDGCRMLCPCCMMVRPWKDADVWADLPHPRPTPRR